MEEEKERSQNPMKGKEKEISQRNEFQENLRENLLIWKTGDDITQKIIKIEGIEQSSELFDLSSEQICFPSSMTSLQRKIIHNVAAELELFHCSIGNGNNRQIIVSRRLPIKLPSEHESEQDQEPKFPFKSNIIHQYFELLDEDKTYRESLVGKGMNESKLELLLEDLASFREQNISEILEDREDYILKSSDLSDTVGVDPESTYSTLIFVNTIEHLQEVCSIISQPVNNEIAFDLEMNNNYVYHGCTCLIQISCRTTVSSVCNILLSENTRDLSQKWTELDILIDPLVISWKELAHHLFPIFANPSLVKICHGARNSDVKALYRDFGIVIVNGFDTQEACRLLGETQLGLANLLMKLKAPGSGWNQDDIENYNEVKHRMSQADWTMRPLPDEMIRYARMDVRFLIPLYHLLIKRLSCLVSIPELNDSQGKLGSCAGSMSSIDLSPIENTVSISGLEIPLQPAELFEKDLSSIQMKSDWINYEAINKVFQNTLSNSSELWTPSIPNLEDKTSTIKLSMLKNKYEAFRKKSRSKTWTSQNTHVFMRLVQWRDRVGYIVNESPTYVCPTSLLLIIAGAIPTNADQLQILYNPLPPYVKPDVKVGEIKVENILEIISLSVEEYSLKTPPPCLPPDSDVPKPSKVDEEVIKKSEEMNIGDVDPKNIPSTSESSICKILHLSIWKVLGIAISIRFIRWTVGCPLFFPSIFHFITPNFKSFTRR